MDKLLSLGVGHSDAPEPAVAAEQACRAALAGRSAQAGDLMVLFATIEYDPHAFFEAARAAAAPAHVIGCSSFSSFTATAQVSRGAVAAFLPAVDMSFGVASVGPVGADIYGAARDVTQLALERAGGDGEHSVLLMLSDGLAGDQREVVRGSYAVTGATVPLVGGAAGENQQMYVTHQYADGAVMTNGLIAVWINSRRPLGVGVQHGWHPVGEPMIVTRAEGNIVHELDGIAAVDAYLAQRETDPLDVNLTGRGEVTFSASMLDEPLGLASVSGRFEVRHILSQTPERGLVMFGHINEQSVIQVMSGDWRELVDAARKATEDAVGQMEDEPRGALVFSCTGRIAPLGSRLSSEVDAITRSLVDAPVAGFFTYGEFARVTGSTGFHNATVVVLTV